MVKCRTMANDVSLPAPDHVVSSPDDKETMDVLPWLGAMRTDAGQFLNTHLAHGWLTENEQDGLCNMLLPGRPDEGQTSERIIEHRQRYRVLMMAATPAAWGETLRRLTSDEGAERRAGASLHTHIALLATTRCTVAGLLGRCGDGWGVIDGRLDWREPPLPAHPATKSKQTGPLPLDSLRDADALATLHRILLSLRLSGKADETQRIEALLAFTKEDRRALEEGLVRSELGAIDSAMWSFSVQPAVRPWRDWVMGEDRENPNHPMNRWRLAMNIRFLQMFGCRDAVEPVMHNPFGESGSRYTSCAVLTDTKIEAAVRAGQLKHCASAWLPVDSNTSPFLAHLDGLMRERIWLEVLQILRVLRAEYRSQYLAWMLDGRAEWQCEAALLRGEELPPLNIVPGAEDDAEGDEDGVGSLAKLSYAQACKLPLGDKRFALSSRVLGNLEEFDIISVKNVSRVYGGTRDWMKSTFDAAKTGHRSVGKKRTKQMGPATLADLEAALALIGLRLPAYTLKELQGMESDHRMCLPIQILCLPRKAEILLEMIGVTRMEHLYKQEARGASRRELTECENAEIARLPIVEDRDVAKLVVRALQQWDFEVPSWLSQS